MESGLRLSDTIRRVVRRLEGVPLRRQPTRRASVARRERRSEGRVARRLAGQPRPSPDRPAEPEQLSRDADGVLWRRTGSCCRCGECCRGNPFDATDDRVAEVDGYCPLFRWAGEGVGVCSDRTDPYYLRGCNVWPQHPQQLEGHPSCSYEFERVDG